MGCDIHLHTEVKINGKWEHYAIREMRRNYHLFALMANVRNEGGDIVPISNPRGIPQDASFLTKFCSDDFGEDGHSHSYLTAEEILKLEEYFESIGEHWPENQWGYFFGNGWGDFTKYPANRSKGVEDIRFVFWFDN